MVLHAEHTMVEFRDALHLEMEAGQPKYSKEQDTPACHANHHPYPAVHDGVVVQTVRNRDVLVNGQEECSHLVRDERTEAEGHHRVTDYRRASQHVHHGGDGENAGDGESEQRQQDHQDAPGLLADAALAGQDQQQHQKQQHQQGAESDTKHGDHGSVPDGPSQAFPRRQVLDS